VLYPSTDKDLDSAVTKDIWDEFRAAAETATHVFVLGHALNDHHLVAALRETKAALAVTFHAQHLDEGGSDPTLHETSTKRIRELLPTAVPVANSFGPKPLFDQRALGAWRQAAVDPD
jgi:hypothetical protein